MVERLEVDEDDDLLRKSGTPRENGDPDGDEGEAKRSSTGFFQVNWDEDDASADVEVDNVADEISPW